MDSLIPLVEYITIELEEEVDVVLIIILIVLEQVGETQGDETVVED
jgi:hypothetical protein